MQVQFLSRPPNMDTFKLKLPINPSLPKLMPLIFPLGVLALSDSILSYATPIYARNLFPNDFIIGLVIAFSSVVGLLFDFVSRRLFGSRNFSFFIKSTFILAIAFSCFLGLSFVSKYFFIFAMASWGIYYETIAFANFKYLKTTIDRRDYTFSWGFINMLKALIYSFGPILATLLMSHRLQLPAYFCGVFVLAAFFLYLALFPKNAKSQVSVHDTTPSRAELKVWLVLFKKIYPLWILNLTLAIVDSGFWTVGILMSSKLAELSPLATLFIPAYMLPAVIFSPLSQVVSIKFGKKKTAIITSLIGSIALLVLGLVVPVGFILLSVLAYSIFTSLAFPAIYGAFEDYIKRLGDFDTDLIGLEQSSTSIAYVVGPILAGFIAFSYTEQKVFFVFGVLLAVISLAALFVMPRRITMPQSELLKVA